ncbi:DUF721 domain-containing protein [Candidatus Acetothermia bacterium]|nr:DUF721 domain-containing protein [Candidatus Acetothermia bacterium]
MNNKIDWFDIINRQCGLGTALSILKIIEYWPQLISPLLTSLTRISSFKNNLLTIEVASPVISQELSLISTQIIERLNYLIPAHQIKEIRLIPGIFEKNSCSPFIPSSQTEVKNGVLNIKYLYKNTLGEPFKCLIDASTLRTNRNLNKGAVQCKLCGCPVTISGDSICSGCRFDGSLFL